MEHANQQKIPPIPSYKEVLQEIGKNLWYRKKLLAKRTLRIIWPVIVFILLSFLIITLLFIYESQGKLFESSPLFWQLIILTGFWLLFAAIYYPIVAWIFSVERLIWVKSYFDKKNFSPIESWEQAKSLARPAFLFMIKIFLRFYLLPISIWIGIVIFSIAIILSESFTLLMAFIWIVMVIIGILLVPYLYYVRVKHLRFIWFVFLDSLQNKNFSFKKIMKTNREINQIQKSKVFKQALLLNLGIDTTTAAIQYLANTIEDSLGALAVTLLPPSVSMPMVGVEKSAQMFTEEFISQAAELSRSVAMYILYQYVMKFKNNLGDIQNQLE